MRFSSKKTLAWHLKTFHKPVVYPNKGCNDTLHTLVEHDYLHKVGNYCVPKSYFLNKYKDSMFKFQRKDYMLIDKNFNPKVATVIN